jgi:transcriptional regulator with XRE-family HTH domain
MSREVGNPMVKSSPSAESEAGAPISWPSLGQRVRTRRIQLGFRKGAVAAHLGVSMERFEAMEAGRVEISPALLGQLSGLMKVPVLYFFEDLVAAQEADGESSERGFVSDEERVASLVGAFRRLDRDKQKYLLVLAETLAQDTNGHGA